MMQKEEATIRHRAQSLVWAALREKSEMMMKEESEAVQIKLAQGEAPRA